MMELQLLVKKNYEDAQLPLKMYNWDAGYDLFSYEDKLIPAGKREKIDTGLSFRVPRGTYGRISPRSGLANKHGIDVLAGVVDSSYIGKVFVILLNTDENDYIIKKGDRIAQLIVERIANPEIVEVNELEDSERGDGGFGSTGNN
jgi:dUTP pyrophosphatase